MHPDLECVASVPQPPLRYATFRVQRIRILNHMPLQAIYSVPPILVSFRGNERYPDRILPLMASSFASGYPNNIDYLCRAFLEQPG